MNLTELPFVFCPKCERDVCVDNELKEFDLFNCPACQCILKVILVETVKRVECEFVEDPYEKKSFRLIK